MTFDTLHCRPALVMKEKCVEIRWLLVSSPDTLLLVSCMSAVTISANGAGVKAILFDTVSDDDEVVHWPGRKCVRWLACSRTVVTPHCCIKEDTVDEALGHYLTSGFQFSDSVSYMFGTSRAIIRCGRFQYIVRLFGSCLLFVLCFPFLSGPLLQSKNVRPASWSRISAVPSTALITLFWILWIMNRRLFFIAVWILVTINTTMLRSEWSTWTKSKNVPRIGPLLHKTKWTLF
jgi:hypothetical protein